MNDRLYGLFYPGWLADRSWCDPVIMYSVCLLVAGLATISFPFLNSYPLLCCYSMIMGIYTGIASTFLFNK